MECSFSPYNIAIIVLVTLSCTNPLNKKYSEDSLDNDFKKIAASKRADTSDTELMAKYILFTKSNDVKLDGKTYFDILDEGKKLEQQAFHDLNLLKKVFESDKRTININSIILNTPPPYFYNDTIKYYYVLLLINGIKKENSDIVMYITDHLASIFPKEIELATSLVSDRKSFNQSASFIDEVANKKIMWFAFDGKKDKINILNSFEKDLYRKNGWEVAEVP